MCAKTERQIYDYPSPSSLLRWYQQAAVDAVWNHLRTRDNSPCVVIPTAGGKSWVMASICTEAVSRWGGRVLILAHVKELLEQNADKVWRLMPEIDLGIYSASLKSRKKHNQVIVAGIQSVADRACELGRFDIILVDESHLIPTESEGRYTTFLKEAKIVNPHVRVIGMTATPYRMKGGAICHPDNILNEVCYEISVKQLIDEGYLSKLKSPGVKTEFNLKDVHVARGDYVSGELEAAMDTDAMLVQSACREIAELTTDRKATLIFCVGINHAAHVKDVLGGFVGAENVGMVYGKTPQAERDETLAKFKAGNLKYLVNVDVLTTGFDAPIIDCIALLRPTMSPGLFYQMVGRGFRTHPSKDDCLILDFGDNILTHGPVDQVKSKAAAKRFFLDPEPPKEVLRKCPACRYVLPNTEKVCSQCGYEFPPPERKMHDAQPGNLPPVSTKPPVAVEVCDVESVEYSVHVKKNAPASHPRTMRVDYMVGNLKSYSEWVCVEHEEDSFPRRKAESWWYKRTYFDMPETADECVEAAEMLEVPTRIKVKLSDKYPEIIEHIFDAVDSSEAGEGTRYSDDDIPF